MSKIKYFINGALASLLVAFGVFWQFESALYQRILNKIDYQHLSEEQQILEIQNAAHLLLEPRLEFFQGKITLGPRDYFLRGADVQLIDGGACGTFVHVAGRLLIEAGFQIRIAQMICNGHPGCHIVLEVELNDRYVVLDPLYNLSFRNADGSLATYEQLHENFSFYAPQLPDDYSPEYNYEGVRYTNWEKIPIILPIIEKIIDGESRKISIRAHILNIYKVHFFLTLIIFVIVNVALSKFVGSKLQRYLNISKKC